MKKARGRSKVKVKAKAERKIKSRSTSKTESDAKAPGPAKKPVKRVDIAEVRQTVATLVGASANEIASGVIAVAKAGQLAPAKYLFEMIGLYPAPDETTAKPQEDSLAHVLLRRLGVPTEPGIEVKEPASIASVEDPGVGAGGGEEQELTAEVAEKSGTEFAENRQAGGRQEGGSSGKDTVE